MISVSLKRNINLFVMMMKGQPYWTSFTWLQRTIHMKLAQMIWTLRRNRTGKKLASLFLSCFLHH